MAWPFIATSVTLIAGYLQGVPPLAYLLAASAVVFAMMTVGIFMLMLMIYQLRPINKLKISGILLGRLNEQNRQGENKLKHLKYGLALENIGMFPLEYKVTPMRASLGASINPRPEREDRGIVQVGATNIFWEAAVPVTPEMRNKLVEGEYDFRVDYGRVSKLSHHLSKKYKVYVRFAASGDITSHEATEAPPPL